MMQGWECPKCGSVYAPHISECKRCANSKLVGAGSIGLTDVVVDFTPDPLPSRAYTDPISKDWKPVFTSLPTVTIPADGETTKGFAGEA